MKTCSSCNIEKDSSDFYNKKNQCKSCYNSKERYKYNKEWRKNNKNKIAS